MAMLLVKGTEVMAYLTAVTSVLLYHTAKDTGIKSYVVSTREMGNGGSFYRY